MKTNLKLFCALARRLERRQIQRKLAIKHGTAEELHALTRGCNRLVNAIMDLEVSP